MPPKKSTETKRGPTGRASNYAFGRTAEKKIGKLIKEELGGTYRRTEGSRGPFDVSNKTENGYVLTQVKAARAGAKHEPRVSPEDRMKLVVAAAKKSAETGEQVVAAIALVRGGKPEIITLAKFPAA